MYDEEPRALCNLPLSGTVGILSSLVLLTQVLALFLVCTNNFFIYFFELFIAFGMVFFLSQGVRHKKPGHLTIYIAYLAIYVFMMFFIIFGILIGLSFYPSYKRDCDRRAAAATTTTPPTTTEGSTEVPKLLLNSNKVHYGVVVLSDVDCRPINGAFWVDVGSTIALCFVSIIISCIQIRYTLVLYKYLRNRQREQRATMNVSYQHFVPGAPPRYTPESPYTVQSSPAQVEAGPLPPKPPHPGVATLEAESLATSGAPNSPPAPSQPQQEKNTLPAAFLRVESPPEYSETAGPSETSLLTQPRRAEQVNMEEVDLNDARSPSRVDLLA